MSRTAEPCALATTAGAAPLSPLRGTEQDTRPALRVGMRFGGLMDVYGANVPPGAILLSSDEEAWKPESAQYAFPDEWPMTLLYLPRSYRGPVEAPSWPTEAPDSSVGVVVPGVDEPTMQGYREVVATREARLRSMANHPAGKGRS